MLLPSLFPLSLPLTLPPSHPPCLPPSPPSLPPYLPPYYLPPSPPSLPPYYLPPSLPPYYLPPSLPPSLPTTYIPPPTYLPTVAPRSRMTLHCLNCLHPPKHQHSSRPTRCICMHTCTHMYIHGKPYQLEKLRKESHLTNPHNTYDTYTQEQDTQP